MTDQRPQPERDFESLPDELAQGFARWADAKIFVDPATDERVLQSAREHFGGNAFDQSPRYRLRWWGVGSLAAAAVVGIAAFIGFNTGETAQPRVNLSPTFAAKDIDQSGGVDILDALALARQIELADRTSPPPDVWDFNEDGIIDRRDADAIATAVVKLPAFIDSNDTTRQALDILSADALRNLVSAYPVEHSASLETDEDSSL